ncbi:Beta-carotene 3-hydroxylase 1 [Forsythia ovata]|uniref:beta-carotene 3-hydroxylase n=1 Tax=Forsythia ovata TaxID=205694 RepID=A0ABD1WLE1_9LAMI
MAAEISVSTSSTTVHFKHSAYLRPKPTSIINPTSLFPPSIQTFNKILRCKNKHRRTVCLVLKDEKLDSGGEISAARLVEKLARKKSESFSYLAAAVMSTLGFTSMAVLSVYYRFSWLMEGGEVPYAEMFGTFALSIGAAVGMEFWARWAHRALWHASMWHMHESHHRPREGPFELNDVFAIINAVPAIALFTYGFFHKGLIPGLCFGAGLGITVFGMAYMFVHDGLVHRRFPVGPIANVPYFRRVAAAHQLHHSDKFSGVPYGLFLGPQEVEEVGGIEELEKEVNRRRKFSKS